MLSLSVLGFLPVGALVGRLAGILGGSHVVIVWIGLFVLSIWLLGVVVGAPLSILLYLLVTARQESWRALLLAGRACLFVEGIMGRGLRIAFPPGSLLEWAGLLNRWGSV